MKQFITVSIALSYLYLFFYTLKNFNITKRKDTQNKEYFMYGLTCVSYLILGISYLIELNILPFVQNETLSTYGYIGVCIQYILKLSLFPFEFRNLVHLVGHYLFSVRYLLGNTPFIYGSASMILFFTYFTNVYTYLDKPFSTKIFIYSVLALCYLYISLSVIHNI